MVTDQRLTRPLVKGESMTQDEQDIANEHGHPKEPCEYRGLDMWSCGHVDNDQMTYEGDYGDSQL